MMNAEDHVLDYQWRSKGLAWAASALRDEIAEIIEYGPGYDLLPGMRYAINVLKELDSLFQGE